MSDPRGSKGSASCDTDPIHTPGSIQPHGVLFVVDEPDFRIRQASANAAEIWNRSIESILDRRLDELTGAGSVESLKKYAAKVSIERNPTLVGTIALDSIAEPARFAVVAHRIDGCLIVELEFAPNRIDASETETNRHIQEFLFSLGEVADARELARRAAADVRRITGYDRVLVYRFDSDWNGTVIAEDRDPGMPSYLDLRFPASDVPAPARELYAKNRIRLVVDVESEQIPIVPSLHPRRGEPVDQSYCILRSVSPIHIEYLKNMNTAASMSISILREGELWGLLACHHRTPRKPSFAVRSACDFIGGLLSMRIASSERTAYLSEKIRLKSIHEKLLAATASADDFRDALVDHSRLLFEYISAEGAAIVQNREVRLIGRTPPEHEVARLGEWILEHGSSEVFHTESSHQLLPDWDRFHDRACGVLAISISKLYPHYLIWFRPEAIRSVTWAGEPLDPDRLDGGLHPRASFEAWKEIVRGGSNPWSRNEIEAAIELRNSIVGIVLKKAEELARLSSELEHSNKELEAFSYSVSHDLRAPFRHILGYAQLLRELEGGSLGDEGRRFLDNVIDSAVQAGLLVDSLISLSKTGQTALNPVEVDMNALVHEIRRELERDLRGRNVRWIVGDLPPSVCDLTMIRSVVYNYISNALKFSRGRDPAVIEIGGRVDGAETIYHVRDNGVGFDMKYVEKLFGVFQRLHRVDEFEGTGIGLANARRIVARHGGRTWAEGAIGRGAVFHLSLPRREYGG
jgi:light-regulated signal transduction histidine kinase (bacteriophytochrome)